MSEYCKIKGYECGLSLGENKCVMDKPCNDIAEWISEHDAKIQAKTIDECINAIDEEYYDCGYGTYSDVEMVVRILKNLKEQKNEPKMYD